MANKNIDRQVAKTNESLNLVKNKGMKQCDGSCLQDKVERVCNIMTPAVNSVEGSALGSELHGVLSRALVRDGEFLFFNEDDGSRVVWVNADADTARGVQAIEGYSLVRLAKGEANRGCTFLSCAQERGDDGGVVVYIDRKAMDEIYETTKAMYRKEGTKRGQLWYPLVYFIGGNLAVSKNRLRFVLTIDRGDGVEKIVPLLQNALKVIEAKYPVATDGSIA